MFHPHQSGFTELAGSATATLAYFAMTMAFRIVCVTTGHYSLEAIAGFTTCAVPSIALGVEGSLWLRGRSFRLGRRSRSDGGNSRFSRLPPVARGWNQDSGGSHGSIADLRAIICAGRFPLLRGAIGVCFVQGDDMSIGARRWLSNH